MKPGLQVGDQAILEVIVTPEMYAQFEEKVIHPVYSTFWMVHHMEFAARKLILPYLEEVEEGIGSGVTVQHRSPTPAGQKVTVIATVTELVGTKIEASVQVKNEQGLAGEGKVNQVILPKETIAKMFNQIELTKESE